ncbi:MAG: response regulator transcription factor [Gammaproteobacteria bacterium]
MSRSILIVEDDAVAAADLSSGLQAAGYDVHAVGDGREALEVAAATRHDAIVLDRMLPSLDGLAVLRELRAARIDTPVLVLSALSTLDDRVKGLRAGGDDYLVKPFAFSELLARLEALLRRRMPHAEAPTRLACADLEVDLLSRRVVRAGKVIDLVPREFQLLEYLLRHQDQLVTRTMLLEGVWGYHFDPQTNVIDVHISRLRQKIDRGHARALVQTVRNAGYVLSGERRVW